MKQKRKPSKEELRFKKEFYNLMFELDLFNKFKKTFLLEILEETIYGYYAHLHLVTGLSFDLLQDKRKIIEQNLRCLWIMQVKQFQSYAEVQIVTKPIDEQLEYTNPNVKPWECYLGLSFSQTIIKNNNNKHCMFLLAGATGSGKTRFIYMILLSWILSCSPQDVWLYISDIAKNEYVNFQYVRHVKYYASELDDLYEMMIQISNEFQRRKNIISYYRKKGVATNIEEYNKINQRNKLSYCYVLIDEFSAIVPDKTDNKDEKRQKEFILDTIKMLEKTGRSFGIFCFIATQKTTRDEIPPIIKNMSAVRISFRANDAISSEVIMGDNSAMGLADRVAVYSQNGGSTQNYLFSPKITIKRLNELLKPYISTKRVSLDAQAKPKPKQVKITRIPKGISYKEYLNLSNKASGEDEYYDY